MGVWHSEEGGGGGDGGGGGGGGGVEMSPTQPLQPMRGSSPSLVFKSAQSYISPLNISFPLSLSFTLSFFFGSVDVCREACCDPKHSYEYSRKPICFT